MAAQDPVAGKPAAQAGQRSDSTNLLIVVGVSSLSLLVFGAVLWAMIRTASQIGSALPDPVARVSPPGALRADHATDSKLPAVSVFIPRESLAERTAELATAAQTTPLDPLITDEIETFLDRMCEARRTGSPQIRELLDRAGFMEEVARCGANIPDTEPLWEEVSIPGAPTGAKVLNLRKIDRDRYRVIAAVENDNQTDTERFWVMRTANGWRAYDWDYVDLGIRLSEFHSQHAPLELSGRPCPLSAISALCSEAEEYQNADKAGWEDSVTSRMTKATNLLQEIPLPLREWKRHHIVTMLRLVNEELALRISRSCPAPDSHPYTSWEEATVSDRYKDFPSAIHHYEKYLGQTGESIKARRALGELHWMQGNVDAALACWRRLNEIDPRDTDALSRRFLAGEENPDREFVAAQIARLESENLLEIGRWLQHHDLEQAAKFNELCQQHRSDDAATWELIGDENSLDREHSEAAKAYRKAADLSTDAEQIRRLQLYYFEAAKSHNQIAAYQNAEDKPTAFQELLDSTSDDAERAALIELRLKDAPTDFTALRIAAAEAFHENRDQAAQELWKLALQSGEGEPAEELAAVRRQLARTVLFTDGWEAAAKEGDESIAETLGTTLMLEGNWQDLADANTQWLSQYPQSEWFHYLKFRILENSGQLLEAKAVLQHAYQLAQPEDMPALREDWVDLCIELGHFQDAFRGLEPRPENPHPFELLGGDNFYNEFLDLISARLLEDGNIEDLRELITSVKPNPFLNPVSYYWAAKYHFDNDRLDGVLMPFKDSYPKSITEPRRSEVKDLLVRAAVRLGDRTKAAQIADQFYKEDGDRYLTTLTSIAAENDADVIRELRTGSQPRIWSTLYSDPDAARLLDDPALAEVREKFPPTLSDYDQPHDEEFVVFFNEPHNLTYYDLRDYLLSHSGEQKISVEEVDLSGCEGAQVACRLKTWYDEFVLSAGNVPAFSLTSAEQRQIAEPNLRKRIAEHKSWISIRPSHAYCRHRPFRLRGLRGYAILMVPIRPGATAWYNHGKGFALTPEKLMQFTPAETTDRYVSSKLRRVGTDVRLPLTRRLGTTSPEPTDKRRLYQHWKSLSVGEELHAVASLGHWSQRESLPIVIETIQPSSYGWRLFARVLEDSKTNPSLQSGTPLEVFERDIQSYEVRQVQEEVK